MISQKHRLNKALFEEVLKKGRNLNLGLFSVRVLHSPDSQDVVCRLAVVVPKSIVKKSTDRNRIKRQVYESLRLIYPLLPKSWIILFVKKEILKAGFEEIKTVCKMLVR